MPRFHLKESNRHLTSTAGLMLIGHCLVLAELERRDLRLPKRGKIRLSDLVKSYVGLLTLGKSDFEAIEAFRRDRFFQEALGIGQVPGSVWLRQQLEAHAAALREHTDAWSVRLLRRAEAPITAENGFSCLDFDTFVMDNSGTKEKGVGRSDVSRGGWVHADRGLSRERRLVRRSGTASGDPAQCAGNALLSGTRAAAGARTGRCGAAGIVAFGQRVRLRPLAVSAG